MSIRRLRPMQCSNCGAEIGNSKVCEFCGAKISYEMRREQEQINKQGCPQCGSSNIQFRRENQGEIRGKKSKQVVHRTVGFCKDCGYTWYPSGANNAPQKNNLVWWILGWIFFFPAPVMVLIWRKKNTWDIKIKIAVTVVFWLLIFIIGGCNNSSGKSASSDAPAVDNTSIAIENNTENNETASEYDIVDAFIEQYNAIADNKLADPIEIDIQDPEHYRTEFRLNSFKNATSKQCTVDGAKIDIINYGGLSNSDIRMYLVTDNPDLAVSVFNSAAKVLDPTLTDNDLTEADENITSNKNGNYLNKISYYYNQEHLFIDTKADFYNK